MTEMRTIHPSFLSILLATPIGTEFSRDCWIEKIENRPERWAEIEFESTFHTQIPFLSNP